MRLARIARAVLPKAWYRWLGAEYRRRQCALPSREWFSKISIETRTDCNLRCECCPQAASPRPLTVMAEELFKKIINDLAAVSYTGRISPLCYNEPLLDDRLIELIRYAREQCPFSQLHLVTNGTLLTPDLLTQLLCAGLDTITIKVYRKDRDQNPAHLSPRLQPIANMARQMTAQKIRIETRSSRRSSSNRPGDPLALGTRRPLSQFCELPFRQIVVRPDGKVVLCSQDHLNQQVMGDATSSSVASIWFNERYEGVRRELLARSRKGKICEQCDFRGFA